MPPKSQPVKPTPDQQNALLRKAFQHFEENSQRLQQAYNKMQADFKSLNLELDAKNEELRRALEESQSVREHLNSVLQSLRSGVVVVDVNGNITHFNPAAEMIGFAGNEMVGHPYRTSLPHAKDGKGLTSTLKSGQEIKNQEREFKTRNGFLIPVNYSTSLVKNREGKVLGAMETFQDISEIKAMEQEVQHARTLAALGEMSATVAHEIRNPLGGIGTYAALLQRDLEPGDPRRNLVRSIMQGIASLNKIVTNLLVYTRPMRGSFQHLPLNTIMREISEFALLEIREQQKGSIQMRYRFPKRPLTSRIDPEKMQQLFLNLFINAAHAMPQGGAITVALKHTGKSPPGVRKVAKTEWNVVTIRDTGIGIPEANVEKVFNPFFTTKENGTGLGLAIVRRIAEFHSGYIDVKSKIGKGTSVDVYFPSVAA